ncbi:hypothetical protein [Williamsia herbipolensis]|uniref:hypothetical protein n=1 Tax=Williamsia herbipolensis TaxID=1603258 RepID=UPI0005F82046|nr:hypothetical protein [Williamsia herbipolensis]
MSAPTPAPTTGGGEPAAGSRVTGLGERATRLVDSIVATVATLTDPGHPVDAALDGAFATTLDTYRAAIAIESSTARTDVPNAAARGTADAALDGLDILAEAYSIRAAGGPGSAELRDYADSEIRALGTVSRDALLAERSYGDVGLSLSNQHALAAADATNYLHVALGTRDQLAAISEATHAPVPVIVTDAQAREVAEHAAAGPFLGAAATAASRPVTARDAQRTGRPVGHTLATGSAIGMDPKGWAR